MADEPTSQSEADGIDKKLAARTVSRDPALKAREDLLARMDEQIIADRAEDDRKFFASADVDPRAAAMAAQMAKEARGDALDVDRGHRDLMREGGEGEAEPTQVVDGAASVQPADAAERKAREAVRISTKGEDPLGDYVVRVEGKPMFRTLVDGKEQFIPLDRARAQLQKHLAADIRLQQASERQKQLDAREQSLRNVEETFKNRQHPSAQAPAFDDDKMASELVRSLVSEPEDKAAARMATVFKAIRQASAPVLDRNALVREAAEVAVKTIADRDNSRALETGFTQFTKDYPDIASDSDLFNLADKKSETIALEHPNWGPAQIMNEAGRQTREWLKSIGAKAPSGGPNANLTANQQRKQNLVPMPQARSARPAPATDATTDESPQQTLRDIQKSRGQPY